MNEIKVLKISIHLKSIANHLRTINMQYYCSWHWAHKSHDLFKKIIKSIGFHSYVLFNNICEAIFSFFERSCFLRISEMTHAFYQKDNKFTAIFYSNVNCFASENVFCRRNITKLVLFNHIHHLKYLLNYSLSRFEYSLSMFFVAKVYLNGT